MKIRMNRTNTTKTYYIFLSNLIILHIQKIIKVRPHDKHVIFYIQMSLHLYVLLLNLALNYQRKI